MIRRFRVVTLLLCAAACARGAAIAAADREEAVTVPDSVFIEVINDNYYDARLYAVYQGGARFPLGTVAGNQRQAAVVIPWHPRPLVVEVALIVGSGVYVSDRVEVAAGDIVQIRVPPNIESSVVFRRVSE